MKKVSKKNNFFELVKTIDINKIGTLANPIDLT